MTAHVERPEDDNPVYIIEAITGGTHQSAARVSDEGYFFSKDAAQARADVLNRGASLLLERENAKRQDEDAEANAAYKQALKKAQILRDAGYNEPLPVEPQPRAPLDLDTYVNATGQRLNSVAEIPRAQYDALTVASAEQGILPLENGSNPSDEKGEPS